MVLTTLSFSFTIFPFGRMKLNGSPTSTPQQTLEGMIEKMCSKQLQRFRHLEINSSEIQMTFLVPFFTTSPTKAFPLFAFIFRLVHHLFSSSRPSYLFESLANSSDPIHLVCSAVAVHEPYRQTAGPIAYARK